MIGVGLVGYGYAGRVFHSHLVSRCPGLRLVGIVARDPEKRRAAAVEHDVPVYTAIEGLLADPAVRMVIIATPHNTHAALARQALESGRHVVVDKPLTIAVPDADDLLQRAGRRGLMLSAFHNRRWDWDYLTLRHAIEAGLLGRPYVFESTVFTYREPRRTWRAEPEIMGSLFHDWGAHLFDQALQLVAAPPISVTAYLLRPRAVPAIGNHARATIRFADETLFTIEISNLARIAKPRWFVLGDRGALTRNGLDPQERAFRTDGRPDGAQELADERTRVTTDFGGALAQIAIEPVQGWWLSYYENVSEHLNAGAPLAVTGRQARDVVALLDAAVRAARTGEVVPVSLQD